MSRSPSAFRQTGVTKAIKGVQAANCSVVRVLIGKDGQIEVITNPAKVEGESKEVSPLDQWKAGCLFDLQDAARWHASDLLVPS
jgi:hypothetical protein